MKSIDEAVIERSIQAVEEKTCPGGVIGFVRANGERKLFPFGRLTYDSHSAAVDENTIYDVASITKSIPTASLILSLIERGALNLEDLLITFVPEFNNSSRNEVTIRHLLTYTIESIRLSELSRRSPEQIFEAVCTFEPKLKPGSVFRYANMPAFLLGVVAERVFGEGIAQAGRDYFFKPLAMRNTGFLPGATLVPKIAPTEIDRERGEIRGLPHDESAYAFAIEGRTVGHAGLFSTAPDLLNFLEMLLHEGTINGRKFFSAAMVRTMCTNQIIGQNGTTGLGWELDQERFMGRFRSRHTFGKTGFTGCSLVCDIERGIAFVIVSNRTYPRRPSNDEAISALRRDIADMFLK